MAFVYANFSIELCKNHPFFEYGCDYGFHGSWQRCVCKQNVSSRVIVIGVVASSIVYVLSASKVMFRREVVHCVQWGTQE